MNLPKKIFSKQKMDLEDFERQLTSVDIMIDHWVEEEVEIEHKRWKKLTPEQKMKEHNDRIFMLREAEKNNWYCSKDSEDESENESKDETK